MSNIALKWTGADSKMFIARDSFGQVILSGSWSTDAPEWQEWKAVKPSDLLLISLAACSGHDVVMIMERQRQQLESLYVDVEGKQQSTPPYAFTDIHLHYVIKGKDLDEEKAARAVALSEEKYCSVAATVRGVATLSHTVEVEST